MNGKTLVQVPDRIGTTSVSVVTGSGWNLIDSRRTPLDLDAYMTDFGNSIDVVGNSAFAKFQIRINGTPYTGLSRTGTITSQIGAANLPTKFPVPFNLGRGVLIEIYGQILAGAPTTPTEMVAQLGLVYVKPGERPVLV